MREMCEDANEGNSIVYFGDIIPLLYCWCPGEMSSESAVLKTSIYGMRDAKRTSSQATDSCSTRMGLRYE